MAKFKGAVKQCVTCNREFRVPACRAETAICCSRKCKNDWWATQREKTLQIRCKGCGEIFEEYASHAGRRIYCSKACSYEHRVVPDRKGSSNGNWRGGKTQHSRGYIYMNAANHPFASHGAYVLEHRLVMENWLRVNVTESPYLIVVEGEKYLSPEIVVHHKDHDKTNNKIENLECMTQSEHAAHHHAERRELNS